MHQNGAMTDSGDFDAAWLPDTAFRVVGARRSVIRGGTDPLTDTVRRELSDACAWFGGEVVRDGDTAEFVLEVTGGSPADESYTLRRAAWGHDVDRAERARTAVRAVPRRAAR